MIIDLVDSIEYTINNCFTHQLFQTLHKENSNITTVALQDIHKYPNPKYVISRLKQRSLFNNINKVRNWCNNTPIVIFDQDPWQAFMNDSPYKGAYELFCNELNVKSICVTTKWWADYISSKNIPGKFVKMWMLPEYCESNPWFDDRQISYAFIGTLHPHRKLLFDNLKSLNINVAVEKGGLTYRDYLNKLSSLQVFIHSEDSELKVENEILNLDCGLWIKDIEAASRGCFSIRNRGVQSETYIKGIESIVLYNDVRQIPEILNSIQKMDPYMRQHLLDSSVRLIRDANKWQETANTLINEVIL